MFSGNELPVETSSPEALFIRGIIPVSIWASMVEPHALNFPLKQQELLMS